MYVFNDGYVEIPGFRLLGRYVRPTSVGHEASVSRHAVGGSPSRSPRGRFPGRRPRASL